MKRLLSLFLLLLVASIALPTSSSAICTEQVGYVCSTSLGVHCEYSTNPNAICRYQSTQCGCAGGWYDCDPWDPHCPLYQE